MLQFIMEKNVLLYLLAAACTVGVVSQIILRQIYEGLIRDTRNTGEPDGRFLQQLRQRFLYCTHLNERVGDVHALIQKSMMEYRFWGISLHGWSRIGAGGLVISFLCALAGTVIRVQDGGTVVTDNTYFWMGAGAVILGVLAFAVSDAGYRSESLEIRLSDYLENSGAVRDYSEDPELSEAAEGAAAGLRTPIVSVSEGRRAKRRARSETAAAVTRAQKEKNELRENLARVKAGMQETAAAEAERSGGKNAEILRQMDPKEQERILREVLKEFLS